MANKRGQSVTVSDFEPRAKPDLGNGAIARIDGFDAAATAKAWGGLADQAGRYADRAAKEEGKRDGAIAGNDPSFRPSGSTTGLPPFGGPGSKLVHRRSRDDGGVSERR